MSDSIALTLAGDAELIEAARSHERYVAGETLATELSFDGAEVEARAAGAAAAQGHTARIDGRELRIAVERVADR